MSIRKSDLNSIYNYDNYDYSTASSTTDTATYRTETITNCYILYSTQSGRAKACARRVARIVSEQQRYQQENIKQQHQQQHQHHQQQAAAKVILKNGNGNTFDDEILLSPTSGTLLQDNAADSIESDHNIHHVCFPILNYVKYIKQQQHKYHHDYNEDATNINNNIHHKNFAALSSSSSPLLLLFVSTTGDGEHTDTIQQTWKLLLHKSLPSNTFAGVRFCLFCLGDRSYGEKFCSAGRKVGARLLQLGCTLVGSIGYGDDMTPNGGVFRDLDEWIHSMVLPSLFPNVATTSTTSTSTTTAITGSATDSATTILLNSSNPEPEPEPQFNQGPELVPPPYQVTFVEENNSTNTKGAFNNYIDEPDGGVGNRNAPSCSSTGGTDRSIDCQYKPQRQDDILFLKSYSMEQFYEKVCPFNAYSYCVTSTNHPIQSSLSSGLLSSSSSPEQYMEDTGVLQRRSCSRSKNSSTQPTINDKSRLPLIGQVIENKRITATDWEHDTRHLRIDVTVSSLTTVVDDNSQDYSHGASISSSSASISILPYQAGDVASILPCNSIEDVNRFISVLPKKIQYNVDNVIQIHFYSNNHQGSSNQSNPSKSYTSTSFFPGVCYPYWPTCCTFRQLLLYCADIMALPEREDLRTLSYYCSKVGHPMGMDQSDKLRSLSETSMSALFVDYILREKRTWIDVLYDFDSLRHDQSTLTLEVLLALLRPIRPRDYSIASSPTAMEGKTSSLTYFPVEFCVGIVQGTTPLGRQYHGFCTRYLAHLPTIAPNNGNSANECRSEMTQEEEVQDCLKNTKPSKVPKAIVDQCTLPIAEVRLWIRPGSFHRLPLDVLTNNERSTTIAAHNYFKNPVMCIGTGTGIAPLRALLHEREAVLRNTTRTIQQCNYASNIGQTNKALDGDTMNNNLEESYDKMIDIDKVFYERDNVLLFGSRKRTKDFYYQSEWERLEMANRLWLRTAFSRDNESSFRKTYVQHILENMIDEDGDNHYNLQRTSGCTLSAAYIYNFLINQGGYIYVAGNPSMARAVKDIVIELLGQRIDGGEKQARQYVAKLQRLGRYVVEAWS